MNDKTKNILSCSHKLIGSQYIGMAALIGNVDCGIGAAIANQIGHIESEANRIRNIAIICGAPPNTVLPMSHLLNNDFDVVGCGAIGDALSSLRNQHMDTTFTIDSLSEDTNKYDDYSIKNYSSTKCGFNKKEIAKRRKKKKHKNK